MWRSQVQPHTIFDKKRKEALSLEAVFSSHVREGCSDAVFGKRRIWFKTVAHTGEVTHLSHLEPYRGKAWTRSDAKGIQSRGERCNFLRWFRLINLFSPHHLSPTRGFLPAEMRIYTRGTDMCVCVSIYHTVLCTCMFSYFECTVVCVCVWL